MRKVNIRPRTGTIWNNCFNGYVTPLLRLEWRKDSEYAIENISVKFVRSREEWRYSQNLFRFFPTISPVILSFYLHPYHNQCACINGFHWIDCRLSNRIKFSNYSIVNVSSIALRDWKRILRFFFLIFQPKIIWHRIIHLKNSWNKIKTIWHQK